MIKRHLTVSIQNALIKNSVVAVMGPRQSGKTTLIKNMLPDYAYYNLEDSLQRSFANDDPVAFLAQADRMIVDEAQYVPELFSRIQLLVDNDSSRRFVLTGSQNFLMMENISQSLAGRVALYTLLPLSLAEIQASEYRVEDLDEFVFRGGYPRIYDRDLNETEWLADYVQTYIERDVRQVLNLVNQDDFVKFLRSCAAHSGSLVNLSHMANDVGVTPNTIKAWLAVLKQAYIVFTVPTYSHSLHTQVRKSSKLYFYDSGLLCYLLGIRSLEQLQASFQFGQVFETAVVAEVAKRFANRNEKVSLYYLRDKQGNEIDLLWDYEGKLYAVEIKSTKSYSHGLPSGFRVFDDLVSHAEKMVLYRGDVTQERSDFRLVPWERFVLGE